MRSLIGKVENKDAKLWSEQIESGALDSTEVSIDIPKEMDYNSLLRGRGSPFLVLQGTPLLEQIRTEKKRVPIKRAREMLMDMDIELAENDGVVFIDEIDKICGPRDAFRSDRKVSQEGVQRDLLPLIEGCSVQVQGYGKVQTDHVLFICAGAFHDSKPSDLMPEFQ
ncbi:heat shock protein HslVU, ATPase subunit HslU, partial [Reticulomyxa filosa]